jgi:hypothetical protein
VLINSVSTGDTMATLTTYPENKSFLSNNKFEFVLNRIPNFTFLVQSVNLPALTLTPVTVQTPAVPIQIPGNIMTFSQLSLTFMVDEEMQSWYELYNWMTQLANPESNDKRGTLTGDPGATNHITSDATLIIKTNSNNPNWKISFVEVFPTDLGELNFSSIESQDFLSSSVTFSYTYYTAEQF